MGHLFGGKTYDFEVAGQETSSFLAYTLDRLALFWVYVRVHEAEESWELVEI